MKQPAVYMLASRKDGTLCLGGTSDLLARTWQHREHVVDGFTARDDMRRLAWYEMHEPMTVVITRGKQLKTWNRLRKIRLIEERNPHGTGLWPDITGERDRVDSRLRGNDEPEQGDPIHSLRGSDSQRRQPVDDDPVPDAGLTP